MADAYQDFITAKNNLYSTITDIYTGYNASMPAYVAFKKSNDSVDVVQATTVTREVAGNTTCDIRFSGNTYKFTRLTSGGLCKKLEITRNDKLPFVLSAKTMQSDDDYISTVPRYDQSTLMDSISIAIEQMCGVAVNFH